MVLALIVTPPLWYMAFWLGMFGLYCWFWWGRR